MHTDFMNEGKTLLGDLDIDGRIVLILILKKMRK